MHGKAGNEHMLRSTKLCAQKQGCEWTEMAGQEVLAGGEGMSPHLFSFLLPLGCCRSCHEDRLVSR
jgi:hypothetical protein